MKFIKKALLGFVLPLIVIITIFYTNRIYGLVFTAAYVFYIIYKTEANIYAFFGKMNHVKGNSEKALAWFKKAVNSGKAKPKYIISYAYLLLKSGNLDKSEKILYNLLLTKLETDDVMLVKSNLALCLWKRGNLDDAIALLQKVIKDYRTSIIYGSLGYMLILKGDLDKALELNLEAHGFNSANSIICDNLGQTYYLRGEFDKAEEIYTALIAKNPEFPEAYYNYGLLLMQKNENEKALEYFRKAQNQQITFLNTVSREDIEVKIKEAGGLNQ